jgi:PleD family two-component response regulator
LQLFARVRSLVRLKQTMDELRMREETSTQLGVLDSMPVDDEPSQVHVLAVEDSATDAAATRACCACHDLEPETAVRRRVRATSGLQDCRCRASFVAVHLALSER